MATIANAGGAVDAIDIVWTKAWDDCPVIAAMPEQESIDWHAYLAEAEWDEKQIRAQEAEQ